MSMNACQHFEPLGGWAAFTESEALTEMLWTRLPKDDWHYMNFTSNSSVWESRRDASTVGVCYEGERLVEFVVETGAASDAVGQIISQFQVVPIGHVRK
jgi:hypothetical protein